jgi:hypothetical protein
MDLLAGELRDLLEEMGGRWEGSATNLHKVLDERETAQLPKRPEELAKLVLRVGKMSTVLQTSQGWRKVGGHDGKSKRVLRLALTEEPSENAVVAVDPVAGDSLRDNSDNSDNGNSEGLSARRDNGDNGISSRAGARQPNPTVDPQASSDGRRRFTV